MELKHTVTEIVKNNVANFEYYRDGSLYYSIRMEDGSLYQFPIDVTNTIDIGNATFDTPMKAITLMRYINKAIKENTITFIF